MTLLAHKGQPLVEHLMDVAGLAEPSGRFLVARGKRGWRDCCMILGRRSHTEDMRGVGHPKIPGRSCNTRHTSLRDNG